MIVDAGMGISDPNPVRTAGGDFAPRRVNIRKTDLETYGFTAVCVGCQHAQADLPNRIHTEACRTRIMDAMEADDDSK